MYKDMSSILSDGLVGKAKLEHFEIKPSNILALFDGIPVGKYVKLIYDGSILMSDTPMEKRTNANFARNAYGDVLIGGLGIGMIILAIQDNPLVRSITVIEKSQDVIDLIAKQLDLNKKVSIICDDVFSWNPPNGIRYDCIYMDIWGYINKDVYRDEMKPLKRKWGHFLKSKDDSPKRFNACWAELNAKTGHPLM